MTEEASELSAHSQYDIAAARADYRRACMAPLPAGPNEEEEQAFCELFAAHPLQCITELEAGEAPFCVCGSRINQKSCCCWVRVLKDKRALVAPHLAAALHMQARTPIVKDLFLTSRTKAQPSYQKTGTIKAWQDWAASQTKPPATQV